MDVEGQEAGPCPNKDFKGGNASSTASGYLHLQSHSLTL